MTMAAVNCPSADSDTVGLEDKHMVEFPLRANQEGLYFLQMADPGLRAFHTAMAMVLSSESGKPLESSPIVSVLEALLERHPGLRVTFHQTDSGGKMNSVQRIHPLGHFEVCSVQTIARQPPTTDTHLLADRNLQRAIQSAVCKPFNLCSQVFRFSLLRPSVYHAVLVMAFHHIAFDGASLHIVTREILLLLNGESLPKADMLHLGTSTESMKSHKLQRWVDAFKSAECCTRIAPTKSGAAMETMSLPERPQQPLHNFKDERECSYQYLKAPENTSRAIQTLARSWNISPMLVITAAYALTLHKYTGHSDIIFGVMSLGRDHRTRNTVGYLAKQLPFRVNFSSKSSNPSAPITIDDLLLWVKNAWDLIMDGGVELQDLVPHLPCLQRKTDSLPISPLQVAFSYYKVSNQTLPDAISIGDLEVRCELVVPRSGHTHVDLFCEAQPVKVKGGGTQYTLFWEYRKSVLGSEQVRRLQDLMCQSIDAMVKSSSVSDVALASADSRACSENLSTSLANSCGFLTLNHGPVGESQQLSVALGPPAFHQYRPYSVRFEEMCSKSPNSPAFRYSGEEITYSKASLLVNQLAVVLREKGIVAGDHICLYMSRTPWLYLAILAVLKCGGVYVPIALQNPRDRIAVILQAADSKLLLTEKALLQILPRYSGASLCLEEVRTRLQDANVTFLPTPPYHPDQLFNIIFTSGTTGTPRGVAISHGNMYTTIANFQSMVSSEECSFTLASINVSFDAHVLDSLAPLLNGACLVVVESIMAGVEEGVTYCVTTPSSASVVSFPSSMRAMIVGGEAFTRSCYINTRHIPKVYNAYGPSECTIFVTAQRILSEEDIVTVGKPVAGVKALVLDDSRELVPIGAPGTLHIAGATVSKVGYYKDPNKTRKVFFHSPHCSSEVLYCTGDQVRMFSDGRLQFLGRNDDQVKLRGIRFQLLEVESTLALHPSVTSAKAMVLDEGTSDAKLVAFVTPELASIDSILQFVAAKLPSFMVPSVVTPLARMPLTKEGKVNRKALAALPKALSLKYDLKHTDEEGVAKMEAGKTENSLARIFARVLGISGNYSTSANFFASGGHSLQTFRLASLINQQLGCHLSVTHILQHPTPAFLAPIIKEQLISQPLSTKAVPDPKNLPPPSLAPFSQSYQVKKGDWSGVSYLTPVSNIPLSPQLLAKVESFLQRDEVDRVAMESEREAISRDILEDSGYDIPPSSLLGYPSLSVLQSHLKLKMVLGYTSTAVDPLVQLHPSSSPQESPIFFVHAGIIGWPLPYLKLAKALGKFAIAIQRSKDAPTSTFTQLAAYYISVVRSVQPHGPYQFVGVCYGAALVYEISKQLSDEGERVSLAALIGGSPVNEERPQVFNECGQPLPGTPAHPLHFYQSTLQVLLPADVTAQLNTANIKPEEVLHAMLVAFPWLPFTSRELQDAFSAYFHSLRSLWFSYTPQTGTNIEKCLLIRNQQHPFYRSHNYGLLDLLTPSSSLSVLVSPKKLGLLGDEDTLKYVSSAIGLYL